MIPSSYKPIESESPPRSPEHTTNQHSIHQRLLKKFQDVDRSFVVSKLFYFFFYTALGALFPFFSLYYKQLWLTPSQIGILLALRPTVKLICLPLWKMVTDKYSRPKAVYFISIFGWLIGYYGQALVYTSDFPCYGLKSTQNFSTHVPSINSSNFSTPLNGSLVAKRNWNFGERKLLFDKEPYVSGIRVRKSVYEDIVFDESGYAVEKMKRNREERIVDSKRSHLNGQATTKNELYTEHKILKSNYMDNIDHDNSRRTQQSDSKKKEVGKEGRFEKESDIATNDENLLKTRKQSNLENLRTDFKEMENSEQDQNYRSEKLAKKEENGLKSVSSKKNSKLKLIELDASKHLGAFRYGQISKSPKPSDDTRVRYNYWILRTLIVIVILTEIITSPTPMIADSAVIQSLAGSNNDYGRQRLFGFFGLGLAAILVGVWVSFSSFCPYTDTINYLPCFYIFTIAIGATVFVSLFFDFQTPQNNDTDLHLLETLKIFKKPRYAFFLVTIFVTGFAHSLQIAFLFWFLQDIGGTPALFATIILIHSLSEVVMYFLAVYLNKGVGHQGTICIALACYTARFLMYGSLEKPWLILPMEMVQGLTYGGMWSVSTVYIQAPEEAEKMIQSILHGVYWGIGMATGALISGFVIEAYGAQREFLVMSLMMAILCVVHLFILLNDRVKELEEDLQNKRDSGMEKLQPDKKEPENFIGAAAAPLVPCLLYGR